MNQTLKEKVKRVSIGINHRRNFSIPSKSGDIINHLITDEDSPFERDLFTKTVELKERGETRGRAIANPENGDSFSVDIDDIILKKSIGDDAEVEDEINFLLEEIIPYLKKEVYKKFDINNIKRSGLVFTLETEESMAEEMISSVTEENYESPENVYIRFNEKKPDIRTLTYTQIVDYVNDIIKIKKNDEKSVIEFDHQAYYDPHIGNIRDIDFEKLLDNAKGQLVSKIIPLIETDHDEE